LTNKLYNDDQLFADWVNYSPARPAAVENTFEWSPLVQNTLGYRYSLGEYGDLQAGRFWSAVAGRPEDLGMGFGAGAVDPEVLPETAGVQAVNTADLLYGNGTNGHDALLTPSYGTSHQALMPIFLPPFTPLVVAHMQQVVYLPVLMLTQIMLSLFRLRLTTKFSPRHEKIRCTVMYPTLMTRTGTQRRKCKRLRRSCELGYRLSQVEVSPQVPKPTTRLQRSTPHADGETKAVAFERMPRQDVNADTVTAIYWAEMSANAATKDNIQEDMYKHHGFASWAVKAMKQS
jgi:hypothetical protein